MHTCSSTTDGVPCACLRFKPRPLQKADEPVTCLNCLHYDMCHPEAESTSTSSNDPRKSNIPTIVSKYSALLRSSKPKATIDDAREETNAGFLKTDGDDDDSWSYKPTSKNKGQFQSAKLKTEKLTKSAVGSVVLLPVGIKKNELQVDSAPGPAILQSFRRSGLVISKDVDNSPLQFPAMITTKYIDKKLRTLFPKVFTYLDEQHPNVGGQIHWALAAKSGATTMTLSGVSNPCGEDITDTRHPKGKKWNTQSVYFVTRMEIPEEVWVQWDQDGRQDDSEDDTRASQKLKGKKRARSRSRSLDAAIKLEASTDNCSKKKKASAEPVNLTDLGVDDAVDHAIMVGLDDIDYNFGFNVSESLFAGPGEVESTPRPPVPTPATVSAQQESDIVDLTVDYPAPSLSVMATNSATELLTNGRSSTQLLVPSVYWSTSSLAASSSTSLTSQYSSAESSTARSGFRVVTPKRKSWRT